MSDREYTFSEESTSSTGDYPNSPESQSLFPGDLDDINDWIKHEELLIKRKDKREERTLRKENASKAFKFSLGWAIFIGFIILSTTFCPEVLLSQTEYLWTIGTLTITILTYYLVVIRSLFPNKVNLRNTD